MMDCQGCKLYTSTCYCAIKDMTNDEKCPCRLCVVKVMCNDRIQRCPQFREHLRRQKGGPTGY